MPIMRRPFLRKAATHAQTKEAQKTEVTQNNEQTQQNSQENQNISTPQNNENVENKQVQEHHPQVHTEGAADDKTNKKVKLKFINKIV